MEFIDVINQRYSVRGYLDKEVEKEKLDYVLKAATIAPTGVNAQPFKVYVIDTKKYKEELSKIYGAKWFVEAPIVLCVVGIINEAWTRPWDQKNIADIEAELAEVGDVGAVGQDLGTGGHDVVGGDVVAHLQHQTGGEGVGKGLGLGELLDVGTAQDLSIGGLGLGDGSQHGGVVDEELLGHGDLQRFCGGSGVGDVAGQRRGGCGFGRYQIDLTVLGAAAAQEIPVEGTKTDSSGIWRKPNADTRTAGTFQNSRTAGKNIRQCAAICQHPQNLLGSGRNRHAYL